ncbi:hypothetical protein CK203_019812 [Vitis vinifera]|uniref:Uncharacterized protein n=1 Tax=Vitis vinifera TaxID=29760 RepID=A0A438J3F5_VITVI|nr:hypothetical protein CK203_019812 [Vitis vinifera]
MGRSASCFKIISCGGDSVGQDELDLAEFVFSFIEWRFYALFQLHLWRWSGIGNAPFGC